MTKEEFTNGTPFFYMHARYSYTKADFEGFVNDLYTGFTFYCDCITETGFELFHNLFGTKKILFKDCRVIRVDQEQLIES